MQNTNLNNNISVYEIISYIYSTNEDDKLKEILNIINENVFEGVRV